MGAGTGRQGRKWPESTENTDRQGDTERGLSLGVSSMALAHGPTTPTGPGIPTALPIAPCSVGKCPNRPRQALPRPPGRRAGHPPPVRTHRPRAAPGRRWPHPGHGGCPGRPQSAVPSAPLPTVRLPPRPNPRPPPPSPPSPGERQAAAWGACAQRPRRLAVAAATRRALPAPRPRPGGSAAAAGPPRQGGDRAPAPRRGRSVQTRPVPHPQRGCRPLVSVASPMPTGHCRCSPSRCPGTRHRGPRPRQDQERVAVGRRSQQSRAGAFGACRYRQSFARRRGLGGRAGTWGSNAAGWVLGRDRGEGTGARVRADFGRAATD